MTPFRIGFGYDVHQLQTGLNLRIGGVDIPYEKGWVAHSDGDALIHALCDALLGAAGLRDIGCQFPDTDPKYKNIDSRMLLQHVVDLLQHHNYLIGNIDCTIAMQQPKLKPHIDLMRQNLAADCHIPLDCVSIKATTTEHLGFEGNGTGASAYAVALIYRDDHE